MVEPTNTKFILKRLFQFYLIDSLVKIILSEYGMKIFQFYLIDSLEKHCTTLCRSALFQFYLIDSVGGFFFVLW